MEKLFGENYGKSVYKSCKFSCKTDWPTLTRDFCKKSNIVRGEKFLSNTPSEISVDSVKFLDKMVKSELLELKKAKTIEDQVDALVDTVYYVVSFSTSLGINLDPHFRVVHEANMRKFSDGGRCCKKTNKLLKPKGWVSPEKKIKEILEKQKILTSFPENKK